MWPVSVLEKEISTQTQREGHVKAQGGDSHLHVKERGLRKKKHSLISLELWEIFYFLETIMWLHLYGIQEEVRLIRQHTDQRRRVGCKGAQEIPGARQNCSAHQKGWLWLRANCASVLKDLPLTSAVAVALNGALPSVLGNDRLVWQWVEGNESCWVHLPVPAKTNLEGTVTSSQHFRSCWCRLDLAPKPWAVQGITF